MTESTPASMPGPHAPDPENSLGDGAAVNADRRDGKHRIEWTLSGESFASVTCVVRCDASPGSWCRLTCPEGCEAWDWEGHAHPFIDAGYCNVVEWLNADSPIECYDGEDTAPVNAPIEPVWNSDFYTWHYLNAPETSAPDDAAERLRVSVRSDIHHLIQPVIGHVRMFTEGDWETPNREHMEGWIERLRVALAVVDALGDDEARAALASKCGLGYATTPEQEATNAAALRRILSGDSLPDCVGEQK